MIVSKHIEMGGRTLTIETGRFAKQADGSVMVRYGDTMVLATVVASREAKEGQDFFPLQVEYREKTSAAGKIPGGFFKREGRPTEKEVLSSRLIDRPIRPMFPEAFRCETQIMLSVVSSDQENDGDILGAIGASAALMVSDVPFDGPTAEVRVGRIDGQFVINPTFSQLEKSDMDVTVAGTRDSIVMVEGEAKEISEQDMLDALRFALDHIKLLCNLQIELREAAGKPKREVVPNKLKKALFDTVAKCARGPVREVSHQVLKKEERSQANEKIRTSIYEQLPTLLGSAGISLDDPQDAELLRQDVHAFIDAKRKVIDEIIHDVEYEEMRAMILNDGKRLDGRGVTDIRQITIETGVLPRTHGSALFTRGETQSLTSTTLGTKVDEQILDGLLPETTKRFMLHYNFPPFSVGEVGRLGTGRREIGHGNLAERSIKNLLPTELEFPYTVRVVSDILESNGSSSMATVCAGSLALMDAGVPIKRSVAGIAMGLIKEDTRVAILSDILGNEDHLGDMDFKVAGTREGITGFQMDIKIQGISFEIFERALAQARDGRHHILDIMDAVLHEPRTELSQYAPRLTSMKIPTDLIGSVIGPGGKMIRQIIKETGAEINIEDDGTVTIASTESESARKAQEWIGRIVEIPEVGKTYRGKVTRLMDFGAFVEFLPGKEGLVHISHLDINRVNKVSDVVNVGDDVEVKLILKDEEGRYNLSRKALMPGYDAEKEAAREAERRKERSERGGYRHDNGGGHRRSGGDRGPRRH
jgi:polyribonucleotide nucleotidyltransferase